MLRTYAAPLIGLVLAALGLAACETPNPAPAFADLTYVHKQPIRLAVERVEVINEFTAPYSAPHVEHLMPVAPGPAAERWASDVVQAAGGVGTAVVVISDASVTETALKGATGLKGVFTKDQSERYDARLEVRIEVRNPDNTRRAQASTAVTRSTSVAEDISPNERAKVMYGLTAKLIDDFDAAIRPSVQQYLRNELR